MNIRNNLIPRVVTDFQPSIAPMLTSMHDLTNPPPKKKNTIQATEFKKYIYK